jgi:DNA-3-methyladenine glycosylase
MYECLNVVTEPEGRAAAVLIRAVEPVAGEALLRAARETHEARRLGRRGEAARDAAMARIRALPAHRLAAGPALVTAAFDITRADTGSDLLDPRSSLRMEPGAAESAVTPVAAMPRVGIAYADEPWRSLPWRFVDRSSRAVSR